VGDGQWEFACCKARPSMLGRSANVRALPKVRARDVLGVGKTDAVVSLEDAVRADPVAGAKSVCVSLQGGGEF
jgi:hypothetical protein